MCRSLYLYVLNICYYALNTFSALLNLPNRQIMARLLANDVKVGSRDYSSIYARMLKNVGEYSNLAELTYVWFPTLIEEPYPYQKT